jgi:hypothetical protein
MRHHVRVEKLHGQCSSGANSDNKNIGFSRLGKGLRLKETRAHEGHDEAGDDIFVQLRSGLSIKCGSLQLNSGYARFSGH